MPQKDMMHEAGIDEKTAVDWCNFLREECETWLMNNQEEIGGMDDNGDAIKVEIDESKFFHRKYRRGLWRPGHWVFGGVERKYKWKMLPGRGAGPTSSYIGKFIGTARFTRYPHHLRRLGRLRESGPNRQWYLHSFSGGAPTELCGPQ